MVVRDLILTGPGLALADTHQKCGFFAYCDFADGRKLPAIQLIGLEISGFYDGVMFGAWHASYSGFADVLVSGCILRDNLASGMSTYGFQPGSATQQSHVNMTVRDCEVMRNYGDPTLSNPASQHSGSGIIMSGVRGGLIDRCYAHHNGGGAGDNAGGGPVGIWTYSADSIVIQRSLVHDQRTTAGAVDGGGFDIDGGATNCTIQYCYAYDNDGPAFLIAEYVGATPLTNATFRYNIGWANSRRTSMNMASGIHFWNGENTVDECRDIRVYNNLFYAENATSGPIVAYQSGPMAGVRIWNNIFVVQGGERFTSITSNTAAFTFQNNLYWAVDGNYAGGWRWGGTTYTSLAAWRAAAGLPETLSGAPMGLQADPLIADLVAGARPTSIAAMEAMTAFRRLSGSPARNAGSDLRSAAFGSLAVGSRDFWGSVIPTGVFDIGPHETAELGNAAPQITATAATQSALILP